MVWLRGEAAKVTICRCGKASDGLTRCATRVANVERAAIQKHVVLMLPDVPEDCLRFELSSMIFLHPAAFLCHDTAGKTSLL